MERAVVGSHFVEEQFVAQFASAEGIGDKQANLTTGAGVINALRDASNDMDEAEALVKEFLKKLSYYQIEQNKRLAENRLENLQLLK